MGNLCDFACRVFHQCHTQSTPAIIGSPTHTHQSSSSLPVLPMPTPVYQVTPYPSTIESFTSTHITTEGALSGNTSGSFNTNADEDGFEHFVSTPSLYNRNFFTLLHLNVSVSTEPSNLHPDIRFLVEKIYYKGEDFISQLNKQYGTSVIPGTELFVEDLILLSKELIPPAHSSSITSFYTPSFLPSNTTVLCDI